MKVAEYLKEGLRNFVEGEGEGRSGTHSEGCHRVTVFLKVEDGKITGCSFNATKRCKKLLAVTDYMCELVRSSGQIPSQEEILSAFAEEKDREKMEHRVRMALSALKSALS